MTLMELLTSEHVASYLTLTFLEIVLAGDNLVLIAILAGRLPERQRPLARRLGLVVAVFTRLLLLASLFWISHLETQIPLDGSGALVLTPRQIVFGLGGSFLIWKAIVEIGMILGDHAPSFSAAKVRVFGGAFGATILQIALFDVIFSLDSVMTAIGIAQHVEVMAAAIVTATGIMFFFVNPISDFIDRYVVVKVVALNFLVLVGALLVVDALGVHVERAYYYVALAIAIVTQVVYLWLPRWARTVLVIGLLAAGGALVASVYTDLSPVIGTDAAAALRTLANGTATALGALVEELRRWLV